MNIYIYIFISLFIFVDKRKYLKKIDWVQKNFHKGLATETEGMEFCYINWKCSADTLRKTVWNSSFGLPARKHGAFWQ